MGARPHAGELTVALCPCCSGAQFGACCGPLVRGGVAATTAEALMRSRYTAYVRRDEPYLLRTWHASTRPMALDLDGTTWLGLDVVATTRGQADDVAGEVAFVASFLDDDGASGELRETSRFVRDDDAWVYVDGDLSPR